jgi:hypothetical protein
VLAQGNKGIDEESVSELTIGADNYMQAEQ